MDEKTNTEDQGMGITFAFLNLKIIEKQEVIFCANNSKVTQPNFLRQRLPLC